MWRRFVAVVCALASTSACNAVLGIDEPHVVPGDEPGNLVTNGTFASSCEGWTSYQTTADWVPDSNRAGTGSCRICDIGHQAVYSLYQKLPAYKLKPGTHYRAKAFVRTPADATRASSSLYIGLGGNEERFPGVEKDRWLLATTDYTFDGSDEMEIAILNRNMDDGCFLVDDVSVVAVP